MQGLGSHINIFNWLSERRLDNPLAYILMGLVGISLAFLFSQFGLTIGIAGVLGMIAIPAVIIAMFNHQLGISLMLVLGFVVHLLSKYTEAPVGTSMDGLLFIMLFGMLVQQSRKRDWSFAKSSISLWIALWIVYNLLQGLNPVAESRMA
ncbi:MAG: hypothetical protein R2879_06565 [Saprospiraceae bacterium]